MKQYRRVLTIAGSDSGGGAGIQADLKTFSALGCYGMSVICAVTAQNTRGVRGIFPVPPDFIQQQIEAVLEDIGVDAVKIGMLHSPEVVVTVAECLKRYHIPKIVVDPVMVATSGDSLLQDDAVEALVTTLFPLATVITPNLHEAAVMLHQPLSHLIQANDSELEAACGKLSAFGSDAVVLKGGHGVSGQSIDFLYLRTDNRIIRLEGDRIDTPNTHGTGCTLSSAIAAFLAGGCEIEDAVSKAKCYITEALTAGADYRLGHGHGPVHHHYAFWK